MGLISVFFLYIFFRVSDFITATLAPNFIKYLGFFPYAERLVDYHLPKFLSSLANFDGMHYVKISQYNYSQYEQAYFPLYPYLIKLITPLFGANPLLAGIFLSGLAFFLGLYFFAKLLPLIGHKAQNTKHKTSCAFWTIVFLLTFPTSFFFSAVYTEGIFFFFVVVALYFLHKKYFLLASLFAAAASATRLAGIFLIIPFFLKIWSFNKSKVYSLKSKILLLVAPFLGLASYCLYLFQTKGDPFLFFHVQPVFGANRSTNLIMLPQVLYRYIKIFLTAQHNFQYFVSVFEFVIFSLVFTVLVIDLIILVRNGRDRSLQRLGLNLFSLANLIVPTLTGTLSSVPRYALLSLSFFIFLAQIKNNYLKTIIAILFMIIHVVVLGYFTQGYFVS